MNPESEGKVAPGTNSLSVTAGQLKAAAWLMILDSSITLYDNGSQENATVSLGRPRTLVDCDRRAALVVGCLHTVPACLIPCPALVYLLPLPPLRQLIGPPPTTSVSEAPNPSTNRYEQYRWVSQLRLYMAQCLTSQS
jgi:hypothetical protein